MASDPGWCVLDDLVPAGRVSEILDDMRRLLALPPEQRAAGDKPAAGTHHLEELDQRSIPVSELLDDHRLRDAVRRWLPDAGRPVQVSYRSPQPGYGAQRLHADDVPKLSAGPASVVTAIVALVDFTDTNGATRVVPGSHDRPDLQRSAAQLDSHADERLILPAAGSALVFNGHLLHSGTRNVSTAERPALQIAWRATIGV